jgi:hypothetical protein
VLARFMSNAGEVTQSGRYLSLITQLPTQGNALLISPLCPGPITSIVSRSRKKAEGGSCPAIVAQFSTQRYALLVERGRPLILMSILSQRTEG